MMGRLGVWALRVLAHLPLPVLRGLGWVLGQLFYVLVPQRRKVALRNLALCFPGASPAQRRAWARESFVAYCQTWLDRSWLWFAPRRVVEQRLHLHGALHEIEGDAPTIIFAPHFYGLDAAGVAVALASDRPFTSIFTPLPNPVVDAVVRAGRQRFGNGRMLNRSDGVKPIVSGLRQGGVLYLLPDMDFGRNDSVFVPFYGVPAATITSMSRFARLGRAKVVPLIGRLTPTGYSAELLPAWQDYPSGDAEADAALMNQRLQGWIDTMPGQYYWVHKRFKTRPEGEPSLYS
ncbi:lysophospholipid acyltransferase family protein [Acidovorax sp. SRB_24]|uniref:lysophospholipid acyltransferase family protein n=1 Tax=Acidovorax sp. SRB_24 TaxID=1962700 RepID=UPI00145CB40E|nr:lipid A biosynthesis acyltransferase [Acidovorax sp. SRB_24]NMM77345.1 lipid A biosynthesis acyltransferase [Acidovorax sp. SRB_24]